MTDPLRFMRMEAPAETAARTVVKPAIADVLREGIRQGMLAPGQPLIQASIAEAMGVSRIPVREALHALASEGLVTFGEDGGARVTALAPEEVDELWTLRALLESHMAGPIAANATPADAELLRDLGERTFVDAFGAMNTPENMRAYLAQAFSPARIAAELQEEGPRFLLAETDGQAAGYAKVAANEPPDCVRLRPTLEIVRFYVEQRFHGCGVAHALMEACLGEARAGAYRGMFLGVWQENPRAIAFYRKWGFEAVGGQIFQLGDDPQQDVVMERALN